MKTPHGHAAATKLAEDIIQHELEIRRITGVNAGDIASLQALVTAAKTRVRMEIQPHLSAIEDGLAALARWYRLNLPRYGHGRQIDLPSGTLSAYMDSHFKVEVTGNKQDVIDKVARIGNEFLIVTVELDHAAIAANREKFSRVQGLRISIKDNLKVESPLLHKDDAPKESRLKTIIRTWSNPRLKPTGKRIS